MEDFMETLRPRMMKILEQMVIGEDFAVVMEEYGNIAARYGAEGLFLLLEDIMDHSKGFAQIGACGLIVKSAWQPDQRNKAIRVLERIVSKEQGERQLLAIFQLFFHRVASPRIVPTLFSLLRSLPADDICRLWVAGAVFQAVEPMGEQAEIRSEAMWLLLKALRSDDPYSVLVAAMALEQEQVQVNDICRALLDACQKFSAEFRAPFVGYLGKIGANQPEVIQLLISLALAKHEEEGVRLAAIVSLTYVTIDQKSVEDVLLQLMREENRLIITHSAAVFRKISGHYSNEIEEKFRSYLSHSDPGFRAMAVAMLVDIPGACERAANLLVQRLELEDDEEIAGSVASALGQGNRETLQIITSAIGQAGMDQLQRYQYVLLEFARRNILETAELLRSDNRRIRRSAAWALNSIGPVAAPSVPLLNSMLEQPDLEMVEDALIALRTIGPEAVSCTTNLGKLLLSEVKSIQVWANSNLMSIGHRAVPDLQELRDNLPPTLRQPIDRCLAQLSQIDHPRNLLIIGVDGVDNENDLELFGFVADLLKEYGPLSFRSISKKLSEQQLIGQVRADLPCSDSKIRLVINRLEEAWSQSNDSSVKLIDRKSTRKGGLTEEGLRYSLRVSKYLESVRLARGEIGL